MQKCRYMVIFYLYDGEQDNQYELQYVIFNLQFTMCKIELLDQSNGIR